MRFQLATTSRLGNRKCNEDRLAVSEQRDAVLLLVADGLGGHSGGQLAAETAMLTASRTFQRCLMPVASPHAFLRDMFLQCQLAIIDQGSRQQVPMEPKCTLVACLLQNGEATWAHVGDSRLYVIRENVIVEQTTDHSMVEALYQEGVITEEEKETHPSRHKITQCMGSRARPAQPTLSDTISLTKDDIILLCSDGLWGQLTAKDLKAGLTMGDIRSSLESLAQQAEASAYPRSDNVTGIALRFLSKTRELGGTESESSLQDLADGMDKIDQVLKDIKKPA